jgi:hypothetical protein
MIHPKNKIPNISFLRGKKKPIIKQFPIFKNVKYEIKGFFFKSGNQPTLIVLSIEIQHFNPYNILKHMFNFIANT